MPLDGLGMLEHRRLDHQALERVLRAHELELGVYTGPGLRGAACVFRRQPLLTRVLAKVPDGERLKVGQRPVVPPE
jgi:hypothetical protein